MDKYPFVERLPFDEKYAVNEDTRLTMRALRLEGAFNVIETKLHQLTCAVNQLALEVSKLKEGQDG